MLKILVRLIKTLLDPSIDDERNYKQHISAKIDKGYRLVYKLSYLDDKKMGKCFPHTRKLVFHIKKSCKKSAMLKHIKFFKISIFDLIFGFFKSYSSFKHKNNQSN